MEILKDNVVVGGHKRELRIAPLTKARDGASDVSDVVPPNASNVSGDPLFRDYLARALSKPDSAVLDATIQRVGSLSGRELLAWQASGGRLSYSQVVRKLELLRVPALAKDARLRLSTLDPKWSLRLARVMALQNLLPDDRINALVLFALVLEAAMPAEVGRRDARIFCDVALDQGRPDLARAWLRRLKLNKSDRLMVNADLCNPFCGNEESDVEAWAAMFNAPFVAAGLEPVSLLATGDERVPFDRLYCQSSEVADGSMVTVIVSCWRPDERLVTSVASLLNQTWQSIEVIVVDDASPPEFGTMLDRVAALDDRVTVIRQEKNQGTYVARNTGLQIARGEFVTFQDSDDWSHPRRIERQAGFLQENPEVVGITGRLMRVTESLWLGLPGSPTTQEALPLFMFRRAPVMERIGFYDSVRKSADREYIERISVVFGQEIKEVGKEPLGIYRLMSDSLSRSEFKPGWRHAARNIYKDAFDFWHLRIARGESSPYRSSEIDGASFPAPRKFQVDQDRVAGNNVYDVVFVGDWRQYGGPQKSMIEEILALKAAGYRVAICHQEAFRFMGKYRRSNCLPIRQMIHDGMVDEVAMSDRLFVGVLVLRYPPILQFTRHEPSAWRVDRAIVVANQAPHELDGTDVRYRVGDCISNFRHLFGLDATWVPQGPQVRDAIAPLVPPALLDPYDMPGIVNAAEWRMPERRAQNRSPVIGRYSRDNMMKFPGDPSVLLQCYPAAEDIDVRIMGGANCCPVVLAEHGVPTNWSLLPYNDMPVEAFLATLDFFVYYDNDHIVEAFGRSILEALASGVVVILPDKFERVFGEAAVYAPPQDVESLVRKLHGDRDQYRAASMRGLAYVRANFSRESYAARISGLLNA